MIFREERLESAGAQELLGGFVSEIAGLYPGWTPASGPSAEPADFEPPLGAFVVAYVDDQPAGCGGFKRHDEGVAEIKRLYVRPDMRLRGVARRLLAELEAIARQRGYIVVRLDTGGDQPNALRLFESAGYQAIGDYNGNPFARHWFEKTLT